MAMIKKHKTVKQAKMFQTMISSINLICQKERLDILDRKLDKEPDLAMQIISNLKEI